MRHPPRELERFLHELAASARPGDQLPTIRELMRRFGASQTVVQRLFTEMKEKGLIESQVGRGTYFLGERSRPSASLESRHATGSAPPAPRSSGPGVKSVLLLRRSISIVRGRLLVEGLQRRFAADGHRVLEVAYSDPGHARAVLKSLPRFDACILQSTYRTIPIELLASLRDKTEVVAIDGAALVGADVEAVGTEWGTPLDVAVARLRELGHRHIAFATTSHALLATQMGRRRFEHLRATLHDTDLQEIVLPMLPDEDYAARLVDEVRSRCTEPGHAPFTALVAWGIEDGAKFRALLSEIGIEVPGALSVILLGRTDLPNEHAGFFETIGSSVEDQIEALYEAVRARWAQPSAPHALHFTPVRARSGASVAALGGASRDGHPAQKSRSRQPSRASG